MRLILVAFLIWAHNGTSQSSSYIIQLSGEEDRFHEEFSKMQVFKNAEYKLESIFPSLRIYKIAFSNFKSFDTQALRDLKKFNSIREAEFNHPVETREIPNDPLFIEQWDMEIIDAPRAWDVSTGGKTIQDDEIVIAVIDRGYDLEHEDLVNVIWTNNAEIAGNGLDDDENGFVDDVLGPNLLDDNGDHIFNGHGTSVAGIVGANGNNNIGVTGVNWDSKIMLLSGIQNVAEIIKGYNYVLEQRSLYNDTNGAQGAYVVSTNLSLGVKFVFPEEFPLWCSVYDALGEVGVLNVGATVNENANIDELGDLPSTCPSDFIIAVTNTTRFDEKFEESGFGTLNIDLGAPGQESYTISLEDEYGVFGGTSAASPHVAGAIGLLYGIPCDDFITASKLSPRNTALAVRQAILNGVDPLPSLDGITSTGGRLNIFNSILVLSDFCNGTIGDSLVFSKISTSQLGNSLNIEYETPDFGRYELLIFDNLGRKLHYDNFNPPIFGPKIINIPLSAYLNGIYHVVLRNDSNKITSSFAYIR